MRLGGAFPFGQQAIAVPLRTGQQFFIPAGNHMVTLGAQTILQYFDQGNLVWRDIGGPGQTFDNLSCDGYNFRLINASGVASGAQITNAGSGAVNGIGAAVTGVAVSFGAAPTNGIAAAAYPIVGGQINSTIVITAGGSGFLVPPLILIDPPPQGGIQATAVCTISAGAINAVTVTNQGAGYTSVPNAYVIPQWALYPGMASPINVPALVNTIPPGAVDQIGTTGQSYPPFLPFINYAYVSGGAKLTVNPALTGSGTLTGIVMTNYGANYLGTGIPTMTITGAGAAAATALMSLALQSITITSGGVAYAADTHIWISNLGLVAAATNTDFCNGIYAPRQAKGRATQSGGVINATVIEDAGFGFQTVPRLGVIATSGTPPTTVANLTAVVGGVSDVSLLQPAVQ